MTIAMQTTIEIDLSTLPFVRSRMLSELSWLAHGISTRVSGLGSAEGNVGYTAPRDVQDAWRMRERWTRAIGLAPERIVRVRQVHGNGVSVASRDDGLRGGRPDAAEAPIADAIITTTPGLALMTLHADCLPILLADDRRRAVATVHAGWRGTLVDIAGETVRRMAFEFGSRPGDIRAFVGPCISVDAYEVGPEVVAAFRDRWPEKPFLSNRQRQAHLDLKGSNAYQLAQAGIPKDAIEISPLCTVADQDRLFSHRGQGPDTGRFAAIIGIHEEAVGS